MCRSHAVLCFICSDSRGQVIPCDRRSEESGLIELFQPTSCIIADRVDIAFHKTCAEKARVGTMSTSAIRDMYMKAVNKVVPKMTMSNNVDVCMAEDLIVSLSEYV